MAQQYDLFNDTIGISKGISALKDPLGGVTDALMGIDASDKPHRNPADYKEHPRANTLPCLKCKHETTSCCACVDAFPVGAIEFEDGTIEIMDVWPVRGGLPDRGVREPALAAQKAL